MEIKLNFVLDILTLPFLLNHHLLLLRLLLISLPTLLSILVMILTYTPLPLSEPYITPILNRSAPHTTPARILAHDARKHARFAVERGAAACACQTQHVVAVLTRPCGVRSARVDGDAGGAAGPGVRVGVFGAGGGLWRVSWGVCR
jgi:hypothetical protein